MFDRELERVLELVREAGCLLRAEAERPDGPRGAGANAEVDDEICRLLVDELRAAFPDDAIVSEELPELPGTSGRAFHVDPHDGTSHFLRGSRDTSIAVGLVADGQLLLGVVYAPLANPLTGPDGLLVDWVHGGGLRRDERPVDPVPACPDSISEELPILVSPNMQDAVRAWNREIVAPAPLVGCGSVATRAALVAVGEAQGWHTIRNRLGSWDYAAGQALHEASGGALVGGDGEPLRWEGMRPAAPRTSEFFGARSLAVAQELARRYREAFAAFDAWSD